MKIDFGQVLKALNGQPFVEAGENGAETRDLTLKTVAVAALMTDDPQQREGGEQKFVRFKLAETVHEACEPVDMTPEQISQIKAAIGRAYATPLVGAAFKVLNG